MSANADRPKYIEAMLDPNFYATPLSEPPELLQTHISYVILAGDHAFKFKKDVDLGFVDFSTAAKRKADCLRELRLNQRFSPEIYEDVVCLRPTGEGFEMIEGVTDSKREGEYAVRMKRFSQEELFSRMFDAGLLKETHLRSLGRQLAVMHGEAGSDARVRAFGEPEAVRSVAMESLATAKNYVGRHLSAEDFEAIEMGTRRFFEWQQALLVRRRDEGWVRECHGDLHLNNVCWFDDKAHAFDCIEFNEAFRCIDTLYDAAFMFLDLVERGRADLAFRFLNTYLERMNDYRGPALLPLYSSMRAMIRGKVASISSEDEALSDEARADAAENAGRYYSFARRFLEKRENAVFVVCGVSGTGKSTFAGLLAARRGLIHIRSDAVRKHLLGLSLDKNAGSEAYTAEVSDRVYRTLAEHACFLARARVPIVLDATYSRSKDRRVLIDALQDLGITPYFVVCDAPDEVLARRLTERRGDVSDAGPGLIAEQRKNWEPFEDGQHLLRVDTTRNLCDVELIEGVKTSLFASR